MSSGKRSPKTKTKLDPQALLDQASYLRTFWQPRNQRMDEDEELWQRVLSDPHPDLEDQYAAETLVDNGPYTLVEKLTQILAGAQLRISVPAQDPAAEPLAEKVEDVIRWFERECDKRHRSGLRNPLSYDRAKSAVLRGWIVSRLTLNPDDPDFPWRYRLIDPINVYPDVGADGLRAVFHIYRDTVSNIIADYPDAEKVLRETLKDGYSPRAEAEVIAYYDATAYALFVNDRLVTQKELGYGFVPWVVTLVQGAPFTQTPRRRNWVRYKGVGALEGLREIYRYSSRLFSALATEVAKGPNPPGILYGDEATIRQAKTVDTGIGAVNRLLVDRERYEVIRTGFEPSVIGPLISKLSEQVNKAGLPEVAWGSGTNGMPGWAISLSTSAATDVLTSYKQAIQAHCESLYALALRLVVDHLPDSRPLRLVATDRATGKRRANVAVTASEIRLVGTNVEVSFPRVEARGERIALIQAAIALHREKMLSLDTGLGDDFVGLENPGLEAQKILSELIFLNDDWIRKVGIPAALAEIRPESLPSYLASLARLEQKESSPPPAGAPPGFPPSVLPPEAGVRAGLEPGVAAVGPDLSGGDAVLSALLGGNG